MKTELKVGTERERDGRRDERGQRCEASRHESVRNRRRQPVEEESFSEKSAGTLARSLARSWPERAKIFPSARHRRCTTPGLNVASQLARRKKRAQRGDREDGLRPRKRRRARSTDKKKRGEREVAH